MAKIYDKKPALAIGVLSPKSGADDESDGTEMDDHFDKASKAEKASTAELAGILGLPPDQHRALYDALCSFIDAYQSNDGEGDDDEADEDSGEETPASKPGLGTME